MASGYRREKLKERLILAAGVILRILYVCFSTIYERQYDIGAIDLTSEHTVSGGHLAYIQYLYQNGHLPDVDPTTVYQFHHPPFHYFVSAAWLRLASLFIKDPRALEESLQVIPLVCSLLVLVVLLKIIRQCGLHGRGERIALSVFAFHPSLILLSGSVNNDGMGLLFSVLCIYETIAWMKAWSLGAAQTHHCSNGKAADGVETSQRKISWRHILLLAAWLGLGIMTKQSVAELAFPIGIVFAAAFFRTVYEEHRAVRIPAGASWKSEADMAGGAARRPEPGSIVCLLSQYAVFLLISVPTAMWFYIRNYIRYGMPLVWVYTLPEDSWQYVGNVPVQYRFLLPKISDLIDNLRHFQIGCGYNVWMQIFRTSVLGEWDMAGTARWIKLLAVILILLGAVLAVLAFLCMIVIVFRALVCKDKENSKDSDGSLRDSTNSPGVSGINADQGKIWMFLFMVYLVNMVFYLKFAYDYPQECSMNFRYITVTLLTPALALGALCFGKIAEEELRQTLFGRVAGFILALFCAASFAMTLVWCFS